MWQQPWTKIMTNKLYFKKFVITNFLEHEVFFIVFHSAPPEQVYHKVLLELNTEYIPRMAGHVRTLWTWLTQLTCCMAGHGGQECGHYGHGGCDEMSSAVAV